MGLKSVNSPYLALHMSHFKIYATIKCYLKSQNGITQEAEQSQAKKEKTNSKAWKITLTRII